jgi:hypothetical protein
MKKVQALEGAPAYPKTALAGASVAGDAVDPEDVAAGVHLHVVALGRRPHPDLRVVEPARRAEFSERIKSGPQHGEWRKVPALGTYPESVGRPRPPSGMSMAARRRPWRAPSCARRWLMFPPSLRPPAGNLRRTWKTPVAAAGGDS